MTLFIAGAIAATLFGVALIVVPLYRTRAGGAPLTAVFVALLLPLTVAVLYAMTSTYPWLTQPGSTTESGAATDVVDSRLINEIRKFIEANPRDADAWTRLGDAYLEDSRFTEARDAYRQVIDLKGNADDELQLAFAEAAILADRSSLLGEAGQVIDEVLGRSPANPKALWYGGMAALGRGENDLARQRWSRLLELSPPPQVRDVIEQQLAQMGGSAADGTAPIPTAQSAAARIPVRVTVKPELAARIKPDATLFLIARAPGGAGPPLAVVRRSAAALPMEIEISDADSMVPGRSMAGLPEIKLTARVANDGEAMPAAGDVYGEASWRPQQAGTSPVLISMDRVMK